MKKYIFLFSLICMGYYGFIAAMDSTPKSHSDSEISSPPTSPKPFYQTHKRRRAHTDASNLTLLAGLKSEKPVDRTKYLPLSQGPFSEIQIKSNTPAKKLDIQKRMASKQMQLTEQWYKNAQQEA